MTAKRFSHESVINSSSHQTENLSLGGGYGSNGFDYSPALPQRSGDADKGETYSVLSKGSLNIGGQDTTTAELGIRNDLNGAHNQAAQQPDLQPLLAKQQTVAQAAATISTAVKTFSSNRQAEWKRAEKAAKEEAQAQLKAQGYSDREINEAALRSVDSYRKAAAKAAHSMQLPPP